MNLIDTALAVAPPLAAAFIVVRAGCFVNRLHVLRCAAVTLAYTALTFAALGVALVPLYGREAAELAYPALVIAIALVLAFDRRLRLRDDLSQHPGGVVQRRAQASLWSALCRYLPRRRPDGRALVIGSALALMVAMGFAARHVSATEPDVQLAVPFTVDLAAGQATISYAVLSSLVQALNAQALELEKLRAAEAARVKAAGRVRSCM